MASQVLVPILPFNGDRPALRQANDIDERTRDCNPDIVQRVEHPQIRVAGNQNGRATIPHSSNLIQGRPESVGGPLPRALRPSLGSGPITRPEAGRATEPPSASRPIPVAVPAAGACGPRGAFSEMWRPLRSSILPEREGDRSWDRPGLTTPETTAAVVRDAEGDCPSCQHTSDHLAHGGSATHPIRRTVPSHFAPLLGLTDPALR
jgi:hypothetical protein